MRRILSSPTAVDASSTAPLLVTPAAGAGGSSSNGESSFESNMVIVLASLLSILICALSLNSLIRCALDYCYARRRAAHAADVAATLVAAAPTTDAGAGLEKKALRRIPVAIYEGANNKTEEAAECAICLSEFAGGDKVRLLPRCRHGFHVRCIDVWFAAHSSCPICRNSLLLLLDDHQHQQGGDGEATHTVVAPRERRTTP